MLVNLGNLDLRPAILRSAPYLVCPSCHSDLTTKALTFEVICVGCGIHYRATNLGQIDFVNTEFLLTDRLDLSKERIKQSINSNGFNLLHMFFTPTFPILISRIIPKFINKYHAVTRLETLNIVNIGGGNFNFDFALTVDIRGYKNVDLIADAMALPFSNESVDFSFSRALIEHLENPCDFAKELERVGKKGSLSLHIYPLAFPIHGSPQDFFRFTPQGIERVFRNFVVMEKYSTSGPFSAICVYLSELLASLLSFGVKSLKPYWLYLSYIFLSPIKWLDFFFLIRKAILPGSVNFLVLFKKL